MIQPPADPQEQKPYSSILTLQIGHFSPNSTSHGSFPNNLK